MAREKRERANSVDDEVASVVSQASDNDKEVIVIVNMMIIVNLVIFGIILTRFFHICVFWICQETQIQNQIKEKDVS